MTEPSIILTTPYQDPPNTFRAASISDMIIVCYNTGSFDFEYYVGIPYPVVSIPVKFVNRALNISLQLDITPPTYTFLQAPTDQVVQFSNPVIAVEGGNSSGITAPPAGISQFIPTIVDEKITLTIPPNTTFNFSVLFYEQDARNKSLTNVRNYIQNLDIAITPVNLTGPVYISNVAPDPCTPPAPPPPVVPPEVPPANPNPPSPPGGGGGGGGGGHIPPTHPPFTL